MSEASPTEQELIDNLKADLPGVIDSSYSCSGEAIVGEQPLTFPDGSHLLEFAGHGATITVIIEKDQEE